MNCSHCKILILDPSDVAIGGLLLDAGFPVERLEADFPPPLPAQITARVVAAAPRIVMVGRADATSSHLSITELIRLIKAALPAVVIVYGGTFPAYYWRSVLRECPAVDYILREEGEGTALALAECIAENRECWGVPGLAWNSSIGPTTSGLSQGQFWGRARQVEAAAVRKLELRGARLNRV